MRSSFVLSMLLFISGEAFATTVDSPRVGDAIVHDDGWQFVDERGVFDLATTGSVREVYRFMKPAIGELRLGKLANDQLVVVSEQRTQNALVLKLNQDTGASATSVSLPAEITSDPAGQFFWDSKGERSFFAQHTSRELYEIVLDGVRLRARPIVNFPEELDFVYFDAVGEKAYFVDASAPVFYELNLSTGTLQSSRSEPSSIVRVASNCGRPIAEQKMSATDYLELSFVGVFIREALGELWVSKPQARSIRLPRTTVRKIIFTGDGNEVLVIGSPTSHIVLASSTICE